MDGGWIYLLRHAEAAAASADGDRGRVLTPRGRGAFEALVAREKPRLHIRRVLTSPYARARQTADILAAALGLVADEERALASGASEGVDLLRFALRAGPGTALVGHNPEIADALAAGGSARQAVAPGTIAALEWSPGRARLAWIATP